MIWKLYYLYSSMINIVPLHILAGIYPSTALRDGTPEISMHGNARALTIRDLVQHRSLAWQELPSIKIDKQLLINCLQANDIVMPSRGERYPARHFTQTSVPVFPLGYMNLIRTQADIDPRYLTWYLNRASTQAMITGLLKGTNIKALNKSSLIELPVAVPSLELQRKIALLDGTSRRAIEIRNRINDLETEEIEHLTESLMKSEEQ